MKCREAFHMSEMKRTQQKMHLNWRMRSIPHHSQDRPLELRKNQSCMHFQASEEPAQIRHVRDLAEEPGPMHTACSLLSALFRTRQLSDGVHWSFTSLHTSTAEDTVTTLRVWSPKSITTP